MLFVGIRDNGVAENGQPGDNLRAVARVVELPEKARSKTPGLFFFGQRSTPAGPRPRGSVHESAARSGPPQAQKPLIQAAYANMVEIYLTGTADRG